MIYDLRFTICLLTALLLACHAPGQGLTVREATTAEVSAGTVGMPAVVTPRRWAGGLGSAGVVTNTIDTNSVYFFGGSGAGGINFSNGQEWLYNGAGAYTNANYATDYLTNSATGWLGYSGLGVQLVYTNRTPGLVIGQWYATVSVQWSGTPVCYPKTNIIGNFVGNGSGLTNISIAGIPGLGTVVTNGGSGVTLTGTFNSTNGNLNQYCFPNLSSHFKNTNALLVLPLGDSVMTDSYLYRPVYDELFAQFGDGGVLGEGGRNKWVPALANGAYLTNGSWWFGDRVIPSNGVCYWYAYGSNAVTGKIFELDYIKSPAGGVISIQTNNGATWVDLPGAAAINTSNEVLAGASFLYTNSTAVATMMRITGVSGTSSICGAGIMNNTGVIYNQFAIGGDTLDRFLNLPWEVTGPILKTWNPPLILCKWFDSAASFQTNLPRFKLFVNTYLTNSDICFVAANPIEADDTDVRQQNWITREVCRTNGWGYFDGWSIFGSFTNGLSAGMLSPSNNVHPTGLGDYFTAQNLLHWLNLKRWGYAESSLVIGRGLSVSNSAMVLGKLTVAPSLNQSNQCEVTLYPQNYSPQAWHLTAETHLRTTLKNNFGATNLIIYAGGGISYVQVEDTLIAPLAVKTSIVWATNAVAHFSTTTIPTNAIQKYTGTATNWTVFTYNGTLSAICTNIVDGDFIIKQLAP